MAQYHTRMMSIGTLALVIAMPLLLSLFTSGVGIQPIPRALADDAGEFEHSIECIDGQTWIVLESVSQTMQTRNYWFENEAGTVLYTRDGATVAPGGILREPAPVGGTFTAHIRSPENSGTGTVLEATCGTPKEQNTDNDNTSSSVQPDGSTKPDAPTACKPRSIDPTACTIDVDNTGTCIVNLNTHCPGAVGSTNVSIKCSSDKAGVLPVVSDIRIGLNDGIIDFSALRTDPNCTISATKPALSGAAGGGSGMIAIGGAVLALLGMGGYFVWQRFGKK